VADVTGSSRSERAPHCRNRTAPLWHSYYFRPGQVSSPFWKSDMILFYFRIRHISFPFQHPTPPTPHIRDTSRQFIRTRVSTGSPDGSNIKPYCCFKPLKPKIAYISGIQPFCSRTPRYNFSSTLYPQSCWYIMQVIHIV
jgi:hypothetical protein